MPTTPDEPPAGAVHATDPEEALAAAEAAHLAARDTVPIDVRPGDDGARRETVRLPIQRGDTPRPGTGRAPLPVAAAVAAAWAALLSYAPIALALAVVYAAEAGPGAVAGSLRLGLAAWLLGHGVPLETGVGPLGLAPLAVAALAAWRVVRAGVHATRAVRAVRTGSVRRAFAVGGAVAVAYGLLGGMAALVVDSEDVAVAPLRAVFNLTVFGLLAGLTGALGATGALAVAALRTPAVVRDGVRTGLVAALLLLGAGAAAAGIAVALAGGEAAHAMAAYRTGVAGQVGITLICAVYAPNVAVWAAAYLIGPGFTLGRGTMVRTTEVTLGELPPLPFFAGLPEAPLTGAGVAVLGVPVVAGMAAGWLLARRRHRSTPSWPGLLGAAVIAGPVAGATLGLAALGSSGALGSGRLVQIGPVAWQVAAVGAAVVAFGALLGAGATRLFRRSATSVADRR